MRDAELLLQRIDFSDGRIERIELAGGAARVWFVDWREQVHRLDFDGVVYCRCFEFGGDIAAIRLQNDSREFDEARTALLNDGGKPDGYPGLVQLDFLADQPLVTLIFQTVVIVTTAAA